MILPVERDPRFITVRRGGSLSDAHHRLLALWAVECAEHVLHNFDRARPADDRPRRALELARAWTRGELRMMQAREGAGLANEAARDREGAARHAAHAAGQAAAVAHVAEHYLGAAAYSIKAARAVAPEEVQDAAGREECRWQRARLPQEIRDLVLEDQGTRNELSWSLFEAEEASPSRTLAGGAWSMRDATSATKHRIYGTSFASVYPLYVQKAEKKGRTKDEVGQVIRWLTGYTQKQLDAQIKKETDLETFLAQAPQMNPARSLIKGVVCGVRVEDIQDPTMQGIRYLDKLVDELAKGKAMDAILRKP